MDFKTMGEMSRSSSVHAMMRDRVMSEMATSQYLMQVGLGSAVDVLELRIRGGSNEPDETLEGIATALVAFANAVMSACGCVGMAAAHLMSVIEVDPDRGARVRFPLPEADDLEQSRGGDTNAS